jgi:hypothetical protein
MNQAVASANAWLGQQPVAIAGITTGGGSRS